MPKSTAASNPGKNSNSPNAVRKKRRRRPNSKGELKKGRTRPSDHDTQAHHGMRPTVALRHLGLLALSLVGRQGKKTTTKARQNSSVDHPRIRELLFPESPERRTHSQWRELRRATSADAKAFLASDKPILAIKKLTRALLEDPEHPAYHELLRRAVRQRHLRRLKPGQKDPWAELPKGLRKDVLQMEAFSIYVDEVEKLFNKAGVVSSCAPPPAARKKPRKTDDAESNLTIEPEAEGLHPSQA